MGNLSKFLALVVLGGGFILISMVCFTVDERQQALVLQFGAPVGGAINEPGDDDAGLKFKLPWQNVVYFDRRNLEFDSDPQEIIVANEERLNVDAFVRYQIFDPLLYFQSLSAGGSDPRIMRSNFDGRLNNILSDAMREQLGSRTISQIINTERPQTMQAIRGNVTEEARKLGASIIDVRIRQADFPQENAERVNDRMVSEYSEQAAAIRAEGEALGLEIRARANRDVARIRADATQQAETIRGRADAVSNCIFANAYRGVPANIDRFTEEEMASLRGDADPLDVALNEDVLTAMIGVQCELTGTQADGDDQRQDFFEFYRRQEAYIQALQDEGTTMIMSPDGDFFRYFNSLSGGE